VSDACGSAVGGGAAEISRIRDQDCGTYVKSTSTSNFNRWVSVLCKACDCHLELCTITMHTNDTSNIIPHLMPLIEYEVY
jgi:hypothetical protein